MDEADVSRPLTAGDVSNLPAVSIPFKAAATAQQTRASVPQTPQSTDATQRSHDVADVSNRAAGATPEPTDVALNPTPPESP